MSKNYNRFLCILFPAVLGLGLVANAITPDSDWSEMENRILQSYVAPTTETVLDGSFMSTFETYLNDQFVGRDSWVSLKSTVEKLVGKNENNDVYFGTEDTLISKFETPDQTRLETSLSYIEKFAAMTEGEVYFSLIPTQASIWADRLPEGAPNGNQSDVLTTAQTVVPSATWVDMETILTDHSDEEIFYRTDHHWTSLGAYYGYVALAEELGFTPISLDSYDKTTVSTEFYGTVFSSSGVRWVTPDQIDIYVPDDGITVTSHTYDTMGNPIEEPRSLYDYTYLGVKDKYSMFLGGQQPLGVVTNENSDGGKLLIIRDSYTDSIVPFLTAHYSEIHLIDLRYYKLPISTYLEENDIDQTLVLYSVPNFVSDSNLVWLPR